MVFPGDDGFVVLAGEGASDEADVFGVVEFGEEGVGVEGFSGEFLVMGGDSVGGGEVRLCGVVNRLEEVLFVGLEAVVDCPVGAGLLVVLEEADGDGGGEEGGGEGGEEEAVSGDGEADERPCLNGLPVVDDGGSEG